MGVCGRRHVPADFPPGNETVPIVLEAGWAPGPVWTGAENLAPPPTGFDLQAVQLSRLRSKQIKKFAVYFLNGWFVP